MKRKREDASSSDDDAKSHANKKQKKDDKYSLERLKKKKYTSDKSIIRKLIKCYRTGLPEIQQLFGMLDEADRPILEVSDLEDKRLAFLLSNLFDSFWKDDVEFVENGYRKREHVASLVHDRFVTRVPTKYKHLLQTPQAPDNAISNDTADDENERRIGVIGPLMPPRPQVDDAQLSKEEKSAKFVSDYNRKYRPKSLVEMHKELVAQGKVAPRVERDSYDGNSVTEHERKKKQEEEEYQKELQSKGYSSWDRDAHLSKTKQMGDEKLTQFVKQQANEFKDSFSRSKYQTSFM